MSGSRAVGEAEMAVLSPQGGSVTVAAEDDATLLVLTGEPIEEPIVGYGPFVMNNQAEIQRAIDDFNAGRFGRMAHV